MLGSIDVGEIQKEKKKTTVSLSLNKKNLDFIKEDLKKNGDGLTLSSLFDFILNDMITRNTILNSYD